MLLYIGGYRELEMHQPSDQEKGILRMLLKSSDLNHHSLESTVSNEQNRRLLFGWKQVRPGAAYIIPQEIRRKKHAYEYGAVIPIERRLQQVTIPQDCPLNKHSSSQCPYMSGYIDDAYSYVYKEGLSSKSNGEGPPSPHSMYKRFHTQTTAKLEPAILYRHPDPNTQLDIARIVAMQPKPELLVEQLLIENRLRMMSLAAFPNLNLEGVGVASDKGERLSNKSGSAPSLRVATQQHQRVQTQHKEKRRKRKVQVPLEWCSLNSGSERSPQLRQLKEDQVRERLQQVHTPEAFQFNNFSYAQQAKPNASPYSKPKLVNPQPNYGSMQLQQPTFISESRETANNASIPVQQSVPVVEPTLETNVLMNGKGRHYTNLQQSSKLSSLLKLWKNTPVRF